MLGRSRAVVGVGEDRQGLWGHDHAPNVSEKANIYASKVTIWGVPAEPSHNDWRGSWVYVAASERLRGGRKAFQGLEEGEDELEGPLRCTGRK